MLTYDLPANQTVEERTVAPIKTPLFVLCDAGETNAFIPIMQRLQDRGVGFHIVLMGTAVHLVAPGRFPQKVHTLDELTIKDLVDKTWNRQQELSEESLAKIRDYFRPSLILTGTANKVEEQFLKLFPKSRKVAYADKFVYVKGGEELNTAKGVAKAADVVFTSTKLVSATLLEEIPSLNVQVMGQPVIEVWQERIRQIKLSPKEQQRIRKRLNLVHPNDPIVTIAHGYYSDDEEIEKFLEETEEILKSKGYNVNNQVHPKNSTPLVPFEEAAAVSDYIISHDSTAGFLALFMNKKVIFAVPEKMKYSNFAIEMGFGPKVTSPKEIPSALRMMELRPTDNLHEKLGIPHNSIDKLTEALFQMIHEVS